MSARPVIDTTVSGKFIRPVTGDAPACAEARPTCSQRRCSLSSVDLSRTRTSSEARPTPPFRLPHPLQSYQPTEPVFVKSP